MKLSQVQPGLRVRILRVERQGVRQRLALHGLLEGDIVCLKRAAPWGGPLLIEADGRDVAIGRGIAEKIEVEPLPCALS
ncbi:MAG: ferrous iron transport protein A [Anaerolineales bacterium]